ncbi:MAG: YceI family protein [Pseudoxanthomonas sp.]
MKPSVIAIAATLLFASAAALAAPVSYRIDPNHTDVYFRWDYLGFVTPSGHAGQADGTLVYDAADPGKSSVRVSLPLSALDAHVDKLNERLRSADYFDAANHPAITFRSTKVEPAGGNRLKVSGELTIRGVTKPVVLDAVLNKAGKHPARDVEAIGFSARTTVKRSDFGIVSQLPRIGDDVAIDIAAFALAEDAPPAK